MLGALQAAGVEPGHEVVLQVNLESAFWFTRNPALIDTDPAKNTDTYSKSLPSTVGPNDVAALTTFWTGYYQRIAHTLEAGRFDLAFFDDRLAMPDRYGDDFVLYRAISQESPEAMAARVAGYRAEGYTKFQLKVGGDPDTDVERIRAVAERMQPGDLIVVMGARDDTPNTSSAAIRVRQAKAQPCLRPARSSSASEVVWSAANKPWPSASYCGSWR